jgi:hypothetical protein
MSSSELSKDGVEPKKILYPWLKANAAKYIGVDLSNAADVDPGAEPAPRRRWYQSVGTDKQEAGHVKGQEGA